VHGQTDGLKAFKHSYVPIFTLVIMPTVFFLTQRVQERFTSLLILFHYSFGYTKLKPLSSLNLPLDGNLEPRNIPIFCHEFSRWQKGTSAKVLEFSPISPKRKGYSILYHHYAPIRQFSKQLAADFPCYANAILYYKSARAEVGELLCRKVECWMTCILLGGKNRITSMWNLVLLSIINTNKKL
jgi:hypothetical protein